MIKLNPLAIVSLAVLVACVYPTQTHGQQASRITFAAATATNTDYWPDPFVPALQLAGGFSSEGLPLLAELAPQTFSGVDGSGSPQTMTFSGTAQARSAFGVLRVSSEGQLLNSFYNAGNDPFYRPDTQALNPNGVPDQLAMTAQASFEDYLQFGGFASQFSAQYFFRITGTMSGFIQPRVFFQIDSHPLEAWLPPAGHSGPIQETWATQRYPVTSLVPVRFWLNAVARFELNTQNWPEGSNVTGSANFGNTVVLGAIIITDEDENIVTGWTLDSDSGTDYLALIDTIYKDGFEGSLDPRGITTIEKRPQAARLPGKPWLVYAPGVEGGDQVEQAQHRQGEKLE